MPDSIGSAVFTVDADISRFDARLVEAQNRATRAIAGINAALTSVQSMDLTIGRGLDLSGEMAKIETLRAKLRGLQSEAQALSYSAHAPAVLGSGVPVMSGEILQNFARYMTQLNRMKDEVSIIGKELSTSIFNVNAPRAWGEYINTVRSEMTAGMEAYIAQMKTMHEREETESRRNSSVLRTISRQKEVDLEEHNARMTSILKDRQARSAAFEKEVNALTYSGMGTAPAGSNYYRRTGVQYETEANKIYNDYLAEQEVLRVKELQLLKAYNEQASSIELERNLQLKANLDKRNAILRSEIENYKMIQAQTLTTTAAGQDAWLNWVTNRIKIDGEAAKKRAAENRKIMGEGSTPIMHWDTTTIDEANKKISNLGNSVNKLKEPLTWFDTAMGRLSRTLFAFTGVMVYIAIGRGLYEAVDAGVEFNKTIENTRIGMAALLESEGKFRQGGEVLSGTKALNAALNQSDEIIKQLQYDNLQTIATFEQLSKAFQSALAPGLAAGFNIQQVRQYTLAMVQAASAMQLPLDMLAEELRSMLRGTITPRNTIIATNLGITNEQIRALKGDSQALFNFIMGKLQEFNKYGPVMQESFSGVMSNLLDIFRMSAGAGGRTFFDYLKNLGQELLGIFADINKETGSITIKPGLIQTFKDFYNVAELITRTLITIGELVGKVFYVPIAAISRLYEFSKELFSISERSKFIADEVKKRSEIKSSSVSEKTTQSFVDATGLEVTPALTASELSDSLIFSLRKLQDERNIIIKQMESNPLMPDSEFADYQGKLFDLQQLMGILQDKILSASDESRNFALEMMYAGDAVGQITYRLNLADKGLKEFIDDLKLAGKIKISGGWVTDDIEAHIEALKKENEAINSGEKAARARIVLKDEELIREAQLAKYYAEYQGAETAASEATKKVDLLQQQHYWNLKNYDDEEKRRKLAQTGGQPRSFTSQFNRENREIDEIRQKSKEAWSQYWIDVMDASGQYYDAEKLKIDKWYEDQVFSATMASRKIRENISELEEKIARGEASKAGNVPETQKEIDQLKEKLPLLDKEEESIKKALEAQKQQKLIVAEYIRLNTPELWMQEQKAISELVGTIEEQVYWENELRNIQNEKNKQGKPSEVQSAMDLRTQLENLRNLNLKGNDTWAGFTQAWDDASRNIQTNGQLGVAMFESLTDSIGDAVSTLAEFCVTGEADFGDFAQALIKNLLAIQLQLYITKALLGTSSGGGLFGGLLGLFGVGSGIISDVTQSVPYGYGMFHSGGIAGDANVTRMIPSSYFFQAPRLHDGLAADEYPAILQKGETVLKKGQSVSNSNNITVNVTQNGGSGTIGEAHQLAEIISKAVDARITENINTQMRNGGILNKGVR